MKSSSASLDGRPIQQHKMGRRTVGSFNKVKAMCFTKLSAAHLHNLQHAAAGVCVQLAALQSQETGAHLDQRCGIHAREICKRRCWKATLPLPGAGSHTALDPSNKASWLWCCCAQTVTGLDVVNNTKASQLEL